MDLATSGLVILPKDLRALECPLCEEEEETVTVLLGQDRVGLKEHVKKKHPEQAAEFDRGSVNYSCR